MIFYRTGAFQMSLVSKSKIIYIYRNKTRNNFIPLFSDNQNHWWVSLDVHSRVYRRGQKSEAIVWPWSLLRMEPRRRKREILKLLHVGV